MKMKGKKNNEIAQELGLHPSTVSTKLKDMRKKLKDLEEKVNKGEIVLKEQGGERVTALAIPNKNVLDQLQNFNQMAGIANAGGAVFGMGAAAVVKGFNDETLPYEQRMEHVMKGASMLGGGILSLYVTLKNLTEETQKPPMKTINPSDTPVPGQG